MMIVVIDPMNRTAVNASREIFANQQSSNARINGNGKPLFFKILKHQFLAFLKASNAMVRMTAVMEATKLDVFSQPLFSRRIPTVLSSR
jgi:hypothetical protein